MYRLGHVLGRGSTATVYAATIPESGHQVAVKVLRNGLLSEQELRVSEYLLGAGVVVGAYRRSHVTGGQTYLEMEWMRGGELYDQLQDGGMDVVRALPILRSAARSVAALHHHGIVHRDIKPENLVFANERATDATLIDFGYAHFVAERCQVRHLVGTFGYVAPETLSGDCRSKPNDVFALGCCFYAMLFGTLPFSVNTSTQGFCAAVEAGPRLDQCPDPIDGWLRRMLHPHPSERPTAEEVTRLGFVV